MKTRFLVTCSVTVLTAVSCIKPGQVNGNRADGGKLVSVSMKMPTRIGDKDVTGKMDGYRLVVSKTKGDCTFNDVDRTEKVGDGNVKIDTSLKQGCDYSILLSFGKMSTDGKNLDQIYLTSDKHDNKPANPKKVSEAELKDKKQITITACVNVTELGAKEFGVSVLECPSISDDSIDATLEPVIPTSAPKLKLTKAIADTVKGSTLELSAEAVSVTSGVIYCALAFEVQFAGNTIFKEMAEDGVIELKTGDKKSIQKPIDIKQITDQGPFSITSIKLLEACQTTKPDASTTAKQLIDKCSSDKTCSDVRP